MTVARRPVLERLLEKTAVTVDGCWLWTGAIGSVGYGNFTNQGKTNGAHRWMYEQLVGPIPRGLFLDHLCRNPLCVRADHLEPVTPGTNSRRSITAQKTHCTNGHQRTPDNIYLDRGQRVCRTCKLASVRRYEQAQAS